MIFDFRVMVSKSKKVKDVTGLQEHRRRARFLFCTVCQVIIFVNIRCVLLWVAIPTFSPVGNFCVSF